MKEISLPRPPGITPPPPPPPRGIKDDIESVARKLIERMRYVYNPEYVIKCEQNEPDSLLGLCKRLEIALEHGKTGKD